MSKRPKFTYEHIDWICYQIGDWYIDWEKRMWVDGKPNQHFLGYAKEQLKEMICGRGVDSESITYGCYQIETYQDMCQKKWKFCLSVPGVRMFLRESLKDYELRGQAIDDALAVVKALEREEDVEGLI
jgi:hypothetical protein